MFIDETRFNNLMQLQWNLYQEKIKNDVIPEIYHLVMLLRSKSKVSSAKPSSRSKIVDRLQRRTVAKSSGMKLMEFLVGHHYSLAGRK